mgnify:CR=1 FL=1
MQEENVNESLQTEEDIDKLVQVRMDKLKELKPNDEIMLKMSKKQLTSCVNTNSKW